MFKPYHYQPLCWVMLLSLIFTACKTTDTVTTESSSESLQNELKKMFDQSEVFASNFTGFMLYDPETDRTIYAQNEKRYFTPASNTKLLTFYTGLKLLPERLPALDYIKRADSLIIWGTADPSFLRKDMDNGEVYHFLKNYPDTIYYSDAHYHDKSLGPGWAWSDYQYAYSAEKSPLPMYGNTVTFSVQEVTKKRIWSDSSLMHISPPYFRSHIQRAAKSKTAEQQPMLFRGFSDNTFFYDPQKNTTTYRLNKPYHYTPQLIVEMLADTLNKTVKYVQRPLPDTTRTLYSIPADSAYEKMLQPSDNFIAEQLLLAASGTLGKSLNSEIAIREMKSTYLSDMPDEPQWVDGSGLSRYNMFTPRSIIWLLQKIGEEFRSDKQLFELLPAGGERGTIEHWYAARDGGPPYVFAKTGTLSNNHCLSGFLITNSGRKLLFSFMNNHYVTPTSVVKEEMEKILWYIHKHY